MMLGSGIKHSAVEHTTLIDDLYLIARLRDFAFAFLQHLVLQTAWSNLHAFFLGILCQPTLAGTHQHIFCILSCLGRSEESGVLRKCGNKTLVEQVGNNRILARLKLLLCSRKNTVLRHLGNENTCSISHILRSIATLESLAVTLHKIAHIGCINLISLLKIRYQTLIACFHSGSIAQRVGN